MRILKGFHVSIQGRARCPQRARPGLGSQDAAGRRALRPWPSIAHAFHRRSPGIPTGFRPKAQGCAARATLGDRTENPPTLKGLQRVRAQGRWNPIGILFALLFFGLAAQLLAQQPADEEGRTRFCAVDIFVDSGSTPLAAYQLRFAVTNGVARIVGIEGGEHPAFHQPPFYDPKALQNEVAILASFNTAPAGELPKGKTRVATIHLQVTGTTPPRFELKLQTAADTQGNKIACLASFEQRKSQ